MKKIFKIGLIIVAMIINQQAFPQKENAKGTLTGEQQIELSEGYSFVSSRIMSENPDMQEILQSNLTNLEFVRNSQGFMLQKIGPNWVNNIGDWVNTEGYLFKMSTADELIITGDVIDPQTPIELSTGYQIIGYLPDYLLNAEEVFEDVLGNLVFVRNTAGLMLNKIGPNWVNSIGNMYPGEGYLVKMTANDVLIYKEWDCGNPIIDDHDGQIYNTVFIGSQCWMAENLNIGEKINGSSNMTNNGVIEKYCYNNYVAYCNVYGGLYQWNEMMEYSTTAGVQGICISGWHLPTDYEWKILEGTVDSQYHVGNQVWNNTGFRGYDAGLNLKSTHSWYGGGNGSGLYDYQAPPGGYRDINGSFYNITYDTYFWSSSKFDGSDAWHRDLNCDNDRVYRINSNKNYGGSVRCLRD